MMISWTAGRGINFVTWRPVKYSEEICTPSDDMMRRVSGKEKETDNSQSAIIYTCVFVCVCVCECVLVLLMCVSIFIFKLSPLIHSLPLTCWRVVSQ